MMSTIGTLICGSSSRGSETSGDRAGDQRREQQQRRQRRIDEGAGENAGKAELHGVDDLVAVLEAGEDFDARAPSSSSASPGCTTTSSPSFELDVVHAGAAIDEGRAGSTIALRLPVVDIDAGALADEIIAEPGDLDVGDHPSALDLRIDDAHPALARRAPPSAESARADLHACRPRAGTARGARAVAGAGCTGPRRASRSSRRAGRPRPTETGTLSTRPAPGASTAPSLACCAMTLAVRPHRRRGCVRRRRDWSWPDRPGSACRRRASAVRRRGRSRSWPDRAATAARRCANRAPASASASFSSATCGDLRRRRSTSSPSLIDSEAIVPPMRARATS